MNDQNGIGYSARGEWLVNYLVFRDPLYTARTRQLTRDRMLNIRREAGLERRCAMLERRVCELEGYIDAHNQHVLKQDAVNKFLFGP